MVEYCKRRDEETSPELLKPGPRGKLGCFRFSQEAIIVVRQFPPRESSSNLVNFESRYGTWGRQTGPRCSVSAEITLPQTGFPQLKVVTVLQLIITLVLMLLYFLFHLYGVRRALQFRGAQS